MMTLRPANHCGKADYGWLQARYAFSFSTTLTLTLWVLKPYEC